MKRTEPSEIIKRIGLLRLWLQENGFYACIIPHSDPHKSEYIEDYYKVREFFSGFDGSAGTLAVSLDDAGLWTDSRYFIQAAIQLENTGINLHKTGQSGTVSVAEWAKSISGKGKIAANAYCFSHEQWQDIDANAAIEHNSGFENLWSGRPQKSSGKAYVHDLKYSGKCCTDKLADLRARIRKLGATGLVVSNLDDIAWLLNLRGSDVAYNPVIRAYVIVGMDYCKLFVDKYKLTDEVAEYLYGKNIEALPYEALSDEIVKLSGKTVCETAKLSEAVFELLRKHTEPVNAPDIVSRMRAVKNRTEIDGYRNAMEKDGVVWVKFLRWFYERRNTGKTVSETDVSDKLRELKNNQELFVEESFGTIAGYEEHGALAHYSATEESNATINNRGLIVIDSGTHYLDGTTDITRTLACGELSDEEKNDYTLVLKGHIALARAVFPEGTKGCRIDAIARQFLWKNNLDYGHGTGHGVGHLLNVHEGYASISPNADKPLTAGMTVTDEPGIYREGSHGIRIENTMLTRSCGENGFGKFIELEPLTLAPIDISPVNTGLLDDAEKKWLADYHRTVWSRLSHRLEEDDRTWLGELLSDYEDMLYGSRPAKQKDYRQ